MLYLSPTVSKHKDSNTRLSAVDKLPQNPGRNRKLFILMNIYLTYSVDNFPPYELRTLARLRIKSDKIM